MDSEKKNDAADEPEVVRSTEPFLAPPKKEDTSVAVDDDANNKPKLDEASDEEDGDAEKGANADKADDTPVDIYLRRCHRSCTRHVELVQNRVHGFLSRNKTVIKRIFYLLLVVAYFAYLGYAIWFDFDGSVVMLIITCLVIFVVLLMCINRRWGQHIAQNLCDPISRIFQSRRCRFVRWTINIALIVGIILFFAIDICRDPQRVTSVGGMLILLFIVYATSTRPARVKWRPVLWGLALQFILGICILRWKYGYLFFRFLGGQVDVFLEYADEGSKFVFGELYYHHRLAFKIFPAVIYFSAVISIFYYWGVMQFLIRKIAFVIQFTMGTTTIETLNAATNIFVGMAEACIILRPFVPKLTKSELHAVMTGGFATVSGSYIALLLEVGATPEHLLSAAIMSAPAALAVAKLNYPETDQSNTKTKDDVYMEKTPARNMIEAASNGAIDAIKVVASVAANLIAILGLIAFLDATLSYFGARVGVPQLSFQVVCSYVFWPLAVIMGVDIADAGKVASLLGTKVFLDEYIAFQHLEVMVDNHLISDRSIMIATYACCGFGSIAAIGIYIGALVSIAPTKRGDVSEVAFRAFCNGNIAGFLTACVAGILYAGPSSFFAHPQLNSTAIANATATMLP